MNNIVSVANPKAKFRFRSSTGGGLRWKATISSESINLVMVTKIKVPSFAPRELNILKKNITSMRARFDNIPIILNDDSDRYNWHNGYVVIFPDNQSDFIRQLRESGYDIDEKSSYQAPVWLNKMNVNIQPVMAFLAPLVILLVLLFIFLLI